MVLKKETVKFSGKLENIYGADEGSSKIFWKIGKYIWC